MHPFNTTYCTHIYLVNSNPIRSDLDSAVKEHERHRAQATNMIKLLEEKLKDQEGIINRLEQVGSVNTLTNTPFNG